MHNTNSSLFPVAKCFRKGNKVESVSMHFQKSKMIYKIINQENSKAISSQVKKTIFSSVPSRSSPPLSCHCNFILWSYLHNLTLHRKPHWPLYFKSTSALVEVALFINSSLPHIYSHRKYQLAVVAFTTLNATSHLSPPWGQTSSQANPISIFGH